MKTLTVDIRQASGRGLYGTIFQGQGKKLFAKGHTISEQDARLLQAEGLNEVWVTELEDGEVAESDAVMEVAGELCCGSLEIRLAQGGRANLFTTEPCCLLVDDDLLRQLNSLGSVAIATPLNFSYARAGQRIATVKSTPFAVARDGLQTNLSMLKERGPVLQARPIRDPVVAVLYAAPGNGLRARYLFENVMRQRLDRVGTTASFVISSVEVNEDVARALEHLLRVKPTVVVIASITAAAGPEDVVGRAMVQVGCHIERFLAPVEPGNLFLLGYKNNIPIVSAPGCFRSAKPNVLDLVLPPLLARYRISSWEVACLGHGGLLA